jgi:hypothetical protein
MSEELTPMNHRELWLKAIATGTVPEWLEPMTHEELWLKAIAQGGGSGDGVEFVSSNDLRWGDNDPDAAQKVYDALQNYNDGAFIGWYTILGHSMLPLFRVSSTKIKGYYTGMIGTTKLQYAEYVFTWNSTTKKFTMSTPTNAYYTMTPD